MTTRQVGPIGSHALPSSASVPISAPIPSNWPDIPCSDCLYSSLVM